MLLRDLTVGQSGIISKVSNQQLEVIGIKKGAFIRVINKNGNDFVIDINGIKQKITYAQSQQISIF